MTPAGGLDAGFVEALVGELRDRTPASKDELERIKLRLARTHRLGGLPSDLAILERMPDPLREDLRDLLRVKPARTASGVAVVTVMTAPHGCPHGVCTYCPGGPRLGTPQSYMGTEPVAQRAAEHHYDPRGQTVARIEALQRIGHDTDKVDLIVLGGTFTALEAGYREWFVKGCFDGLNGFEAPALEDAQDANESAASRCIGLTIETKPDCFLGPEVAESLALGATRVELGVQTTHDDVLEAVHRGHTDAQSREAIRVAKSAGLKVGVHMMPGLPGSDPDRDMESFRGLFEDPSYRPDFLKIYPTLVLSGTALHGLWKSGRYTPLRTDEAVELIARVKAIVPRWCRIQRVQREIGAPDIEDGAKRGDLRVLAKERLRSQGLDCHCVRCREVGFRAVPPRLEALTLLRNDYDASGGLEVFLSIEDPERDVLVAYARLRIGMKEATVRELKVFGRIVPIHESAGERWQHRGFGRRLMSECERIARDEFHVPRMRVMSGVGVRGYYRSLGYRLDRPYMERLL
ncbi:MAG: tRNA uridine(34) 5-carboxymethylaminomethyl modification radical SAM/GNAT enzyme Elp3 [Methanobacteriota archaeon]|nr:MAG: tRNA uridine(34) 5-carboxymethylaminomethyl modification radical SAM/GNAT enzyme Elp3 [Euryarchaeota archaeon]